MEETGEDNGGTPKPCKQVKVKQKPKKTTKPSSTTTKRTAQDANMDEIEMEVIKSLKKDISIHQKNANPKQDPDDLFASDLAADIRLLPLRSKVMAKHVIRSVLFKYQMEAFPPHNSRLPSQGIPGTPNNSYHASYSNHMFSPRSTPSPLLSPVSGNTTSKDASFLRELDNMTYEQL